LVFEAARGPQGRPSLTRFPHDLLSQFKHLSHSNESFGERQPAPVCLTLFIGIALEAVALVLSFYRRLAPGDRLPGSRLE